MNRKHEEVGSIIEGTRKAPLIEKTTASDQDLNRIDREQDIGLKRQSHQWVSSLVTFQLIAADILVFFYLSLASAKAVDFDSNVLKWWITGTVVETLGMGYIVVKYLFRREDSYEKS